MMEKMYIENSTVSFGICADVHKDIMHDADVRLRTFVNEMNQRKVDFIIHLGDFCFPDYYNGIFLSIWNEFNGPRYHVIGNHDTQGHHTKDDVVNFWSIPKKGYYSFDVNEFHFVVLDANEARKDPPPSNPDFPSYIGEEQFAWLKNDLLTTNFPSFIFSHQTLEDERGVDNWKQVRELLEDINERTRQRRVVACFCGDLHLDAVNCTNGIYYVYINSMSNYWMGDGYQTIRYNGLVDSHYPWIKYTAPYKDPLYAVVTIKAGKMIIEGKESEYVGPSPQELGFDVSKKKGKIWPIISSVELDI